MIGDVHRHRYVPKYVLLDQSGRYGYHVRTASPPNDSTRARARICAHIFCAIGYVHPGRCVCIVRAWTPRYVSQATLSWVEILAAMKLDNTFADQSDRWHRAVWMGAITTPRGLNSGAYPALWCLSKWPRWCSLTGARPHPSTAGRMCMLAAHVAHRHKVGAGRQIGLFWVETSTQLFQDHMFRYISPAPASALPAAFSSCGAERGWARCDGAQLPLQRHGAPKRPVALLGAHTLHAGTRWRRRAAGMAAAQWPGGALPLRACRHLRHLSINS